MGRKPTRNLNLPSGLRAFKQRSGKVYYYYDLGGKPRKRIPLGSDYALAVKKWAELEIDKKPRLARIITFRYAAERYLREVIPTKAPRSQKDNLLQLQFLYRFFDDPPAPLDQIKPIHIRQYLDWRGKGSKTQANREKALFSHIWNMARQWGYTDLPNPCAGIKGFREAARLDGVKQDGRSNDNHLGRLVGDDCRRLGVHVCRSCDGLLLNCYRRHSAAHRVDPRQKERDAPLLGIQEALHAF